MNQETVLTGRFRTLGILSTLLLFISIGVYYAEHLFWYRFSRALICFSLLALLFFFQRRKTNPVIAIFLFFYACSSLAAIWSENPTAASASMGLSFAAFMVLIGALSPKIHFRKLPVFFATFSIILVVINAYLLYIFVEMIRDFALGELHYFLMLISSMTLVMTGLLVLLYNHVYSTPSSLIFTFSIFIFIFAEVFRAIAFYDFAYGDISVYIARGLLLVALSLLVAYELTPKNPKEVLGH